MHIDNELYFCERERHDLALRMIRHEARTCTIKTCTGLSEDRIRRLCKAYAAHNQVSPIRRRGKAPSRIAFFTRNAQVLFESACLTSVFYAFGLLRQPWTRSSEHLSLEYGALFCDAFETHRQLARSSEISFEHAWFLLQQLNAGGALHLIRCRHCHGRYLRAAGHAVSCPTCRLKKPPRPRRGRCEGPRLTRPRRLAHTARNHDRNGSSH